MSSTPMPSTKNGQTNAVGTSDKRRWQHKPIPVTRPRIAVNVPATPENDLKRKRNWKYYTFADVLGDKLSGTSLDHKKGNLGLTWIGTDHKRNWLLQCRAADWEMSNPRKSHLSIGKSKTWAHHLKTSRIWHYHNIMVFLFTSTSMRIHVNIDVRPVIS